MEKVAQCDVIKMRQMRGEVGKKPHKKEMDDYSFLWRHMSFFRATFSIYNFFSNRLLFKFIRQAIVLSFPSLLILKLKFSNCFSLCFIFLYLLVIVMDLLLLGSYTRISWNKWNLYLAKITTHPLPLQQPHYPKSSPTTG